ncbi:MAG: hypothetical protein ACXABK_03745 [Candidatus Heimdallarchaeaceae archaeon]|jgi:hypothetical protein
MSIQFEEHVGKDIVLIGKISDTLWQHLIEFSKDYKNIYYLDYESGEQLVFYTKTLIECNEKIKIKGKVIRVVGKSKRPGSNATFMEFQIVADSWECLN